MSAVERLICEVRALSAADLAQFRDWFWAHDAELWDQEFEDDVTAGRLDRLENEALRDARKEMPSDG